ncbi:nostrin-like [Notolabrus celidotus]|uniref:nostrin-like n=1 Tax=Notolabrus celidotus TaxID=1203425 RepID=UPI00148F6887|nr:nostrin-like [Notolabrus celidotus]
MQQIYKQTDEQFEVYTTVFSPQVTRTRTRTRHVEAEKVVVAVLQYRSRWPKELDLNQGDLIQVLFKEDETWWFGRLTDGREGYFPAGCVEPLQVPTHLTTRS